MVAMEGLIVNIVQSVITGLMQGGVYALISIGLTLIFGVMGIINFAQADFMMVGMYAALVIVGAVAINPLIVFFLLIPIFVLFGAAVQKTLINPIIGEQEDAQLILTFGISLILANSALAIFGPSPEALTVSYSETAIPFGPFSVNQAKAIAFVFALGLAGLMFLFLRNTEFGRAMRATANNHEVAEYSGIDVGRMYMAAFGIGIALTACAGVLMVMYYPASPTVGFDFVLLMFVVVVFGGLGSIKGALVAGLLIGVVEQLSTVWLSLEVQPAVVFVLFLIVLIVKPEGLYGEATREV